MSRSGGRLLPTAAAAVATPADSWTGLISARQPPKVRIYASLMHLITTTSEIADALHRTRRRRLCGGRHGIHARANVLAALCLIQLAGPEAEVIVDPLAPGIDLQPFYELMANEKVVKVFHAARQDVEIVYSETR